MKTKDELPECPVATAVALIEGKSQKVLTDSLRQMIDDGLAYRHDYHEMPPRVEYGLTELGKEMMPIIDALADFGNYYKSVIN